MSDVGRKTTVNGREYICVETPNGVDGCDVCAFEHKSEHYVEGSCSDNPCDGGHYVPVQTESKTIPILPEGSKPTNPKDAIGIRKVNLSCLPAGVMMETAVALMEGAAKYGRHNYRGVGVRASVYYDAAAGHLMDWWEGDDIDQESGLSHVTKAIASLVVLRDAMLQGKLTDDRPPRSRVFKRDFNPMAAEVLDRHKDKAPKHWTIQDEVTPADNTPEQ